MTSARSGGRTAAAPLLYWLLVVCGLVGLTVLRFDAPDEVIPLWLGTVVGVALGQLIAWLRVRTWVIVVVGIGSLWFVPVLFFILCQPFRSSADICVYAFLPAAVCGYLSLTERGGLVAFWYPAVLWMLVVLDGPVAGAFDARAALPMLAGLGALFVAYLRARETRRVAIWHAHATVSLAAPLPRTVLRDSPLRAASQIAWSGLVGALALVLAAWIAPHLWQKEEGKHASALAAQHAAAVASAAAAKASAAGQQPCCSEKSPGEARRVRVREYSPLVTGHDEDEHPSYVPACTACRDGKPIPSGSHGAGSSGTSGPWGDEGGGTPGTPVGASEPSVTSETAAAWAPSPASATDVTPSTAAVSPPSAPTTPAAPAKSAATSAVSAPVTAPVVPSQAAVAPGAPGATSPVAVSAVAPTPGGAATFTTVVVPRPAASAPDAGAPWRSMLALCLGGLALHVLVRALRRELTLRHLAHPFWAETLDQRISNHWQRMLIGLRDAGIRSGHHEQPQELARRVGLEGIGTCATILERVRHGVRVDAEDLEAMNAAAGSVYRAARIKAGVAGRAAAWLRWPLA